MNKRRLGVTDVSISEIGLGCWPLGGQAFINGFPITYGDVDEKTAIDVMNYAIEMGVNFFDTADSYSLGRSEYRLGQVLKENRNNIYVCTKGGNIPSLVFQNDMFELDLSSNYLTSALNRSLKRLNTDYVDLFLTHKAPDSKYIEQLSKIFQKIKKENLSKYCGVSIGRNYDIAFELINRTDVDVIELYFSLLDFQPRKGLLQYAYKNGVGIIVAEPLFQGFLTGKYSSKHKFSLNDVRKGFSFNELKRIFSKIDSLHEFTNEKITMSDLSLAYILHHEQISTCIPGVKSKTQLKSSAKSSKIKLSSKKIKEINSIQDEWV